MPEKEMARMEAMINSMTMEERRNPDILNGSRRARIAKGAGVGVAQVNQMVRQFEQMRKMMQNFMGGGKRGLPKMLAGNPFGGIGGLPQMPGMGSGKTMTDKAKEKAIKKRRQKERQKRRKK